VRVRPASRSLAVLLLACVLLPACDDNDRVVSEHRRFELRFAELYDEARVDWAPPYRVVPGTRLCARAECGACGSCEDVPVSATGPVGMVGECFVADQPGMIEWRVGAPCDDLDAPTDRAWIEIVRPEDVAAEPLLWPDRAIARAGGAVQGAALTPELRPPLRIVANAQIVLPVRLYTPADGHVVAWTDGEVAVTTTQGRAPVADLDPALNLVTFADTVADATFKVGSTTWPIGQVIGVPPESAATLAIAVGFAPEDAGAAPVFARAVAHDGDGAALLGLPVTWTIDGEARLAVEPTLPGPDYILVDDNCLPPEQRGGPRQATISARHGDLSATLDLRWTGVAGEPDPKWEPPDNCPDTAGCGCRSQTGGSPALSGLLGLLALRRRRRGRP